MRLPTWEELIEKQKEILEYPLDQPLFAVGPPGSGKTVLAIQRANALAQPAAAEPGQGPKVAIVTYNRMLRRLVSLLHDGRSRPCTMHKFTSTDYFRQVRTLPPYLGTDRFDYDWPLMIQTLAGKPAAVPRWHHMVIDEGQDLPAGFFRYARHHAASCLSVFADEDQALDAKRTTLKQIRAEAGLPPPIILSENHRNTPQIAAVAAHFHRGGLPTTCVHRPALAGTAPRLIRTPNLAATAQRISQWYKTYKDTIGVVVSSNSIGAQIYQQLQQLLPDQRVDIYTSQQSNEEAIALLDTGITVLNQQSVKGQEFGTLFLVELEQFVPCDTDAQSRVMYMLCSRARNHLLLVYGPQALSPAALAALPPAELLER